MVQDGTPQDKAEAKVLENKEKLIQYFDALLDIINDPQVLFDMPRKIKFASKKKQKTERKRKRENPMAID